MKKLNAKATTHVNGAGVPMPTPHLNGPSVSKETSDFAKQNGSTMAAGVVGSAIGAAAGALGGPVGSIIGGGIGAAVASAIKGAPPAKGK